jgi:DNA invertase Pin-like site-specific DNA recombinase
MTLNVLLSFAQFEREVTSERIRDKIAVSKRNSHIEIGALIIVVELKGTGVQPTAMRPASLGERPIVQRMRSLALRPAHSRCHQFVTR